MKKLLPVSKCALSAVALGLAGCASGQMMQSLPIDGSEPTAPLQGIPYYLPIGYVPISLSGSLSKPTSSTKTQTQGGGNGGGGANAAAKTPQKLSYSLTVGVGAVQYTADPTAEYLLQYTQDQYADDHASIRIDQNGLLEASSGHSTDQSGAAAAAIVQLLGEVAEVPFAFGGGGVLPVAADVNQNGAKATTCDLPGYTGNLLIVPNKDNYSVDGSNHGADDSSKQDSVNAGATFGLSDANFTDLTHAHVALRGTNNLTQTVDIYVDSTADAVPDVPVVPKVMTGAITTSSDAVGGLVFRNPRPYTLRIQVVPSSDAITYCAVSPYRGSTRLMLPNGGAIFRADTSRTPLVEKQISFVIQNGMLMGEDVDKPSQFYQGVLVPANTLKAILSIPSSVLSFKVQQMQAEGAITDEQAKQLESEIQLIKDQANLTAARAAAAPQ